MTDTHRPISRLWAACGALLVVLLGRWQERRVLARQDVPLV